ncbi:MAG TPA: hypothetical protein PKU95_02280 [Candidatus Dojkabacteria bacterium]|nr:hypothetical protein [Candidatus Dojkabacteria bacterium]
MSAPNLTKSLDHLFISKVRIKSLKYFIFNPDIPIHLRGLVRELKEEINAVRRELTRLDEIGFIKSETRGNRKYFLLNREYIFLPELLSLFHKTFGLGGLLIKNAEHLGEVEYIALTGTLINFQPPNPNIIDLIVVGQIDLGVLGDLVHESEKKLNREINYTVMKSSEFVLKKKRRDAFIMQMLTTNKIMLKGNVEEFAA